MTDELVERLHDRAYCGRGVDSLCLDAAAEIQRLREVCQEQHKLLVERAGKISGLEVLVRALRDVNTSLDSEKYKDLQPWASQLEKIVAQQHARIEELTHAMQFIGKSAELFIKEGEIPLPEVSRSPEESFSSTCEGGNLAPGTGDQASLPRSDDLREAAAPPAEEMPTP